jgi:hypothetical protein
LVDQAITHTRFIKELPRHSTITQAELPAIFSFKDDARGNAGTTPIRVGLFTAGRIPIARNKPSLVLEPKARLSPSQGAAYPGETVTRF